MHAFRSRHPGTLVEMVNARPREITEGLVEGGLDLGLLNVLPGDDVSPDLQSTELLHGRPVVCCRSEHRFAQLTEVRPDDLLHEPFVAMRSGYLMHRYAHRLFGGKLPATSFSTDGAEMGKLMVADGLGVTILPDYSIDGDPIVRSGLLTHRPLAGDTTRVTLLMLHRKVGQLPPTLLGLKQALIERARAHTQSA